MYLTRAYFERLKDDPGTRAAVSEARSGSRTKQWRLCGIPHNRHSFAVRVLVSWYRSGIDVEARMVALSTYLGHVNPVDTYWYYSDSRVIPIPAPLPA